jgi:hypothetical protein
MKKALIIIASCILGLSLAITLVVMAALHFTKANHNLGWGPEPRTVKILSVDAIPVNVFDGIEGGGWTVKDNSGRYYYRSKAVDAASGASLLWKLSCDQAIQPPATMTYTPLGNTSASLLEIRAVVSGPYKDEQEATASLGGAIPADEELLHSSGTVGAGSEADTVYVLQRVSIVAGNDFRTADPSINQYSGQREVLFTLTSEAGGRFYDYTSKNVGQSMAVVMGGRVREVAKIQSAIRDRGVIQGSFTQSEVAELSKLLRTGAKPSAENNGSLSGTGNSNPQNHCKVIADDGFGILRWLTR